MNNSELLQSISIMLDTKLQPIETRLDRLETKVDNLETNVSNLQSEVTALQRDTAMQKARFYVWWNGTYPRNIIRP